jgi:hypothetical protein
MRKWFYAGAVVGSFLLLGAAPAHADLIPSPADGLLPSTNGQGIGLDPAGSLNLESPLGGANQLVSLRPGQNSTDLQGSGASLSDMLPSDGSLFRGPEEPTGRAQDAGLLPASLPVARGAGAKHSRTSGGRGRVAGGLPTGSLTGLIPTGLLGGSLLGGGLLSAAGGGGAARESALFDGGLPLLGGLGGLMPVNETPDTHPADDDDVTGMPAGGTLVDPADGTQADPATVDPAITDPAITDPATTDPAIDEPVMDPRVHEEPIDDEAGADKRSFSEGGRPIAGEDEDFK